MKNLEFEDVDIPIKTANIKLKGTIYYTLETPSKAPWIIILSGFLAHRGSDFVKEFIERFARVGYFVLSYDYRGHGENINNADKFELYKLTPKIFSDISKVVDWVIESQSKRILDRKLYLFGRSYGGGIVLTYGFKDKRLKKLIALCARYDYSTVQLKIPDDLKINMSKIISPKYFLTKTSNNNERVFIAHCKDDKRIPFNNVLEIKDHLSLREKNVVIYENGGHSFEGHKDHLFKCIIEFLKEI
ncbi:MAG: alpha/beta hydrolase family protein [Candidatus Hermodarchaeota archaeon]